MRSYLVDVVGGGRTDLIASLAHPDMVDEANLAFGGPAGREGLVAHVKGFNRHVADCEITVRDIVGDEAQVMAWWSFSGMHIGPWLGIAPTGERINGTVFSFFALTDGLISRYRLWLHTSLAGGTTFDSAAALDARHGR